MKYIFIDFAETIAYRVKNDYWSDIKIVENFVGISGINEAFQQVLDEFNIYDRSDLWFGNLEEESDYYIRFFSKILYILNKDEHFAKKIVLEKMNECRHKIYSDVLPFLKTVSKNYSIIIVTDGRPSRRKSIESLNIGNYISNIYTSDELGFHKSSIDFFKKVLKIENVDARSKVTLIDDDFESVMSAQNLGIHSILINRRSIKKVDAPKTANSLEECLKLIN